MTFAEKNEMRYFGVIVFGFLMAISMLAVLWISHGAGVGNGAAMAMGLAASPFLYMIFVGPFAILFVVSLIRIRKQ